jgi:hypothetical protein
MALDVAALFPTSAPMQGGMAGMFQGLQAGTAVNAAQQQMDAQGMQNQTAAINLQNLQADQPNVALDRQLKGLNLQSGITNQPLGNDAAIAGLKANIAKQNLSATDDDLAEQHTRFSGVVALGKYFDSGFDPGDMDQQKEANRLATVGHPDHKFQLFGAADVAKTKAAMPAAQAAQDEIANTIQFRQKSKLLGQETASKERQTGAEVAGREKTTAMVIQGQKDVELLKLMAQQGQYGLMAAQEFMKLPKERQLAASAQYEQATNTDRAISPETFTKIKNNIKDGLEKEKDPDYMAAATAATKRGEAWNAMDTDKAKAEVIRLGLLTKEEVDAKGSKQDVVAAAVEVLQTQAADRIAEKRAKADYPKVDPKIQPFDAAAVAASYRLQTTANRVPEGGAPPRGTSAPAADTSSAVAPPKGVPPGFTDKSGTEMVFVKMVDGKPMYGPKSKYGGAGPAASPAAEPNASMVPPAPPNASMGTPVAPKPDFSNSPTLGGMGMSLLQRIMNDSSSKGRQSGQ